MAPDRPADVDRSTHPSVARVLGVLSGHGISPTILHLPDAVRTAQAAAEALGVTPAEIANSLVFAAIDSDGEASPLLILTSGGHRVDTERVRRDLGLAAVERADPAFVRARTGFAIGGVAPVGHVEPVRTLIDTALARYEQVWAAAGHSHSVFATTYDELVRITSGTPAEVSAP